MRPVFIRKRWFLPPWGPYEAITLYPFIILPKNPSERTTRHELIHYWQVQCVGWLRFYITYIIEWWRKGYRENKYEVEAYDHEYDTLYLPESLERYVDAVT